VYSEKTPNDGQRYSPKHVEFYSKNKFEKSVHLVGSFNKKVELGGGGVDFLVRGKIIPLFKSAQTGQGLTLPSI